MCAFINCMNNHCCDDIWMTWWLQEHEGNFRNYDESKAWLPCYDYCNFAIVCVIGWVWMMENLN